MECGAAPMCSTSSRCSRGWTCRLRRRLARLHLVFDAEVDRRLRGREDGEPGKEQDEFIDVLLDVVACDGVKAGLDRDTLRALFAVKIDKCSCLDYSFHCSRVA